MQPARMLPAAATLALSLMASLPAVPGLVQHASAQAGKSGVERLYILNCGEGVAGDISRWSPGVNVGKSMDFVDNCYLIKHSQGWLLWDTGVADAIAAMPEGQRPAGVEEVDGDRGEGARGQPPEAPPGGGPLPEHGHDEGGEQGCVEEREQQLDVVHDVAEPSRYERCPDADQDTADRDDPTDIQVVAIGSVLAYVVLPDVIGEHVVEGTHVGRHAGHERREQAGQRDSERSVREVLVHEYGDRVVIFQILGLAEVRDKRDGDQSGNDGEEGDEDLWKRPIRGVRSAADRFFADNARCTSAKFVVQ